MPQSKAADLARKLAEYARRRAYAFAYLGGRCACCGATEGLEIDHADPWTKRFGVLKRWSVAWQAWHDELEKCQLLCVSCHLEKTLVERQWRHEWVRERAAMAAEGASVPF